MVYTVYNTQYYITLPVNIITLNRQAAIEMDTQLDNMFVIVM